MRGYRRADRVFTKPGRIRASRAEHFQRISRQGFPFTIDLIYVRLATRHRGARHRQGPHTTPNARCSHREQGIRATMHLSQWPGPIPDVRPIFRGFSSDFQVIGRQPRRVCCQGIRLYHQQICASFTWIGYGWGWGQAAEKPPPAFAFVRLSIQFLLKTVLDNSRGTPPARPTRLPSRLFDGLRCKDCRQP